MTRVRLMQSETINSHFAVRYLGLTGFVVALLLASEVGAEALCPAFPSAKSFAVGDGLRSVAVADFDGDSVPDLVTANRASKDVSVLLGNGDGSFQTAASFAVGDGPHSVAVADLDGDSVPDLVTANPSSKDVSVLRGNGDGSFQAALAYPAGNSPESVAVADFDGDSVPDLVTANPSSNDVSVLRGNGDGSFQAAVVFAAGDSPYSVAAADLDGDSVPDLVTANYASGDVSVLLGNGDGSFQTAASFAVGDGPHSVAVADLDGDSVPDLVTAGRGPDDDSGDVHVLLGNGDGSFQAAASFPAGNSPGSVAVADLDGDSVPDLVTSGNFRHSVSVRLGNGDGSFQTATSFAAGYSPVSLAVADLDGDSAPDLVAANRYPLRYPGKVSVLLGNGDGSLQAATSFAAGYSPISLAVADLDGDSDSDLVTANRDSYSYSGNVNVNVLLGNGDGNFQAAAAVATGRHSQYVGVADLDGDGVPDLVNVVDDSNPFDSGVDVRVLLGNGDGSFHAPITFPMGSAPQPIPVADLDGDSVPDLAIANYFGYGVSVLLGNGDGSFQAATYFAVGKRVISVAVADFDGDGAPDFVTGNPRDYPDFANNVSVLLGNGDGTFQTPIASPAASSPDSVVVADLDGDGVPDLVTAGNYFNAYPDYFGDVSVLLGNGDGSFRAPVAFPAGNGPQSIAVVDLDGDGVPDIVAANLRSDDVSVLLGNGDGSFQAAISFAVGREPISLAVADLDGDGLPDLVTANRESHDVTVLFNQCAPPPLPVALDIKPGSDSNPINPAARGKIPVAILGSEAFDVMNVDVTTLTFGPAAASPSHDLSKPGVFEDHLQDVNGDGYTDLLSHYRIQNTGIVSGNASACLTATTLGGAHFEACDGIRTLRGPRGRSR